MMYQQLLEVYFGENDNIREMQKCIDELRDYSLNNPNKSISTHQSIIRFNRLAEKEWGFRTFSLVMDPGDIVNAYTMPVLFDNRMRKNPKWAQEYLTITNNGYRYKDKAKISAMVVVYRGLFDNKYLTNRDVMAIILHEVGHNFSKAISDDMPTLNFVEANMALLYSIILAILQLNLISTTKNLLLLNGNHMANINKMRDTIVKKVPWAVNIKESFHRTLNHIFFKFNKKSYFRRLPGAARAYEKYPEPNEDYAKELGNSGGVRDEKIADNFCTIYGYGIEQAHALQVISSDEIIKSGDVSEYSNIEADYLAYCEAVIMFKLTMYDVHPTTISRVQDQANYLKKELKRKNIDPKMRKEIEDQMKKIDDYMKKITDINNSDLPKWEYYSVYYNNLNLELFGGDIKDKYGDKNQNVHQDLQKVYDRIQSQPTEESTDIFLNAFKGDE